MQITHCLDRLTSLEIKKKCLFVRVIDEKKNATRNNNGHYHRIALFFGLNSVEQ